MSEKFPEISAPGGGVDAKQFIEPGTSSTVFFAFFVAIVATLFGILISYGILLIVLLCYPLIAWHTHRKATALIHGSGLKLSETQFPEIYRCAMELKGRLGITKDVDVYIIEANVANAMAVRYGKKNVILLTDDLIHGCLASGCPQALSFVMAHELAHIALDHNGIIRSWMSRNLKKLGRLDEYSADSVATALVGDKDVVFHGILMLTVGYALLPYVDKQSVIMQAQEVSQNKYSKKAEKELTHPLLLNRLFRILKTW